MTRGLVAFSLAFLVTPLAGCGPSLESKLVGRWRLDTQSIDLQKALQQQMQQQTEGNEAGAAMAEAFAGMMQAMMGSMSIDVEMDFRPDHTLATSARVSFFGQSKEDSRTGTWKVESTGDNQLTVSIATDDGKTNTVVIKFVDDNTFTAVGNVPGAGNQEAKFIRVTQQQP
jgi:hypothetical protein